MSARHFSSRCNVDSPIITKSLQVLVEGLSHPEEPQDRKGKPGDPQLSALCQLLLAIELGPDDVIADFGAGNGVLPEYLARIWPPGKRLPEYWAVDLPDLLDRLSLPARVHNHSKKVTVEEFLKSVLPTAAGRISMVVVRNTLHELDIATTSELLGTLWRYMKQGSHLYIQDMARLAKPERGNVAWPRDLLQECLEEIGFETRGFDLPSHGGTPWFGLLCRRVNRLSATDLRATIARRRAIQLERIAAELKEAAKQWDRTDQLLLSQHEYSSLALQLDDAHWTAGPRLQEPALEAVGVPVVTPKDAQVEFACALADNVSVRSGLIAFLSTKSLLDFPKLIGSARSHVHFGGYSNRPLFRNDGNLDALERAIRAGSQVAILVVDPDSDAARYRAAEPIYDEARHLINDIRQTIEDGQRFFARLCESVGKDLATARFKLRASGETPRSSYFRVDDVCYIGFYSISLTGRSAPCFVFRAMPGVVNNYVHVAQKDFDHLFGRGRDLI